jgi:hypothetical protein
MTHFRSFALGEIVGRNRVQSPVASNTALVQFISCYFQPR